MIGLTRALTLSVAFILSVMTSLSLNAAEPAASPIPTRPLIPSMPPEMEWTGFYIGINGGYGWSDPVQVSITDPRVDALYQRSSGMPGGFIGGAQFGYNWQTGHWLFGFETDLQYADLGGVVAWENYDVLGVKTGEGHYFGTIRARLGYAMDRTLVYLTGGFAYGGLVDTSLQGRSGNQQGFTVGGGFEYAFTQHWTGRFEGLYVNFDQKPNLATISTADGLYALNAKSGDGSGLVRVGVNYKF